MSVEKTNLYLDLPTNSYTYMTSWLEIDEEDIDQVEKDNPDLCFWLDQLLALEISYFVLRRTAGVCQYVSDNIHKQITAIRPRVEELLKEIGYEYTDEPFCDPVDKGGDFPWHTEVIKSIEKLLQTAVKDTAIEYEELTIKDLRIIKSTGLTMVMSIPYESNRTVGFSVDWQHRAVLLLDNKKVEITNPVMYNELFHTSLKSVKL